MKFSGVLVAPCSEVFQQPNGAILLAIFRVDARCVCGEHIHVSDLPCTLAEAGKRLQYASSEPAILQCEGLQGGFHVPRIGSKIVHVLRSGLCRRGLEEFAKLAGGFLNSLEINGHRVLVSQTNRRRFRRAIGFHKFVAFLDARRRWRLSPKGSTSGRCEDECGYKLLLPPLKLRSFRNACRCGRYRVHGETGGAKIRRGFSAHRLFDKTPELVTRAAHG